MKCIKVYLAGPDVFCPNAIELGEKYVEIAKNKGLVGLFPLDNQINMKGVNISNPDACIYRFNRDLIDSADYMVANLNDFRGNEPDSGTVWEVAYAIGKGKKVIGYMNSTQSIVDRIKLTQDVVEHDGQLYDNNGFLIENFGNPLNLMLQNSIEKVIEGNIENALDEVVKLIKADGIRDK